MAKTVGKKSKKVRVAIIGVGNCASSLVQGVEYYKDAAEGTEIPGIMHTVLGGYHIGDVEFSAAIDIDADKVGKDLSEAIFSGQNNTYKFANPPKSAPPPPSAMPFSIKSETSSGGVSSIVALIASII